MTLVGRSSSKHLLRKYCIKNICRTTNPHIHLAPTFPPLQPPSQLILQILDRRLSLLPATAILPNLVLARPLISLEQLNLGRIHMLHHGIGLPFLKAEPQALMRIVLVVGLVLVVFDLDEIAIDGVGREGEGHERVDGCGFGDDLESPTL